MEQAAQSPALAWLWGARVQRVDGPAPDRIALTLFERGAKQTLLLVFGRALCGVGSLPARPKGAPASAFVQRLRTPLEGARLEAAHWLCAGPSGSARHADALLLTVRRGERTTRIVVDFDAKEPNLLLLADNGSIAGAADERARRERFPQRGEAYRPRPGEGIAPLTDPSELLQAGERLVATSTAHAEHAHKRALEAQARAALKRATRKVEAIRADLARAEQAPRLRREAGLLLSQLGSIAPGSASVRLLDESVEPAEWLDIRLDPPRSPQQVATQRFERARKLERGLGIAGPRLAEAESAATRLRALLARLAEEAVEQLADEARALGLKLDPQATPAKRRKPPARVPYRVFVGNGEQRILVGKGAADNDALTLTVARPHDHWLHVRGAAGSHVVVPLQRKQSIPPQLLLDAAHLAAHFSKQRGEATVEIAHTERRFVRKTKGSPPGTVTLERERVFVLRVEPARLQQLLAGECVDR